MAPKPENRGVSPPSALAVCGGGGGASCVGRQRTAGVTPREASLVCGLLLLLRAGRVLARRGRVDRRRRRRRRLCARQLQRDAGEGKVAGHPLGEGKRHCGAEYLLKLLGRGRVCVPVLF